MPLPFIIGGLAAAAGVAGVGSGIHGAAKMKEANDTMKAAERKHKQNIEYFENESEKTNKRMDKLGELELKSRGREILTSICRIRMLRWYLNNVFM